MTEPEIIRPFGKPQKKFLGCMGLVLLLIMSLSAKSLVASKFGWVILGMGGLWSLLMAAFMLLPTKVYWVVNQHGIFVQNGLGDGSRVLESIPFENILRLEWFSDRYAILRSIFVLTYQKDGKQEVVRITSYQLSGINEICERISQRVPGKSQMLSWKEAIQAHHATENGKQNS